MKKIHIIVLLTLFQFSTYISFAQTAVGDWQDHLSYRDAQSISEAEEIIYVGTEKAVFSYNKSNGIIKKISKVNGLSDVGIRKVIYNRQTKALVILYQNSNIDILKNNRVYNFSEIKQKQINGDKNIYNCTFIGSDAYLACGFGIVKFDTDKLEFSDTYFIGENASQIVVNDITFDENKIYAATNAGILYAYYNYSNLSDYKSWQKITNIENHENNFSIINYINNKLYTYQTNNRKIYINQNNDWNTYKTLSYVKAIEGDEEQTIVTQSSKIVIYETNGTLKEEITNYQLEDSLYNSRPYTTKISDNGNLLIADRYTGLVIRNNDTYTAYYPNGPYDNNAGQLLYKHNRIYLTTGAFDRNGARQYHKPVINILNNNEWKSIVYPGNEVTDFYSIYVDEQDPEHIYTGSWGRGVYEFQNDSLINWYERDNSTLENRMDGGTGDYVQVAGIINDENNNMWFTNYYADKSISVLDTEGSWYSTSYRNILTEKKIRKLYLTSTGIKWADMFVHGLFAFDDKGTPDDFSDDDYKEFYPISSDATESEKEINCIAEDKDNDIWVGTASGIFVYYNPESVFETSDFRAERIKLTAAGNDTTTQYLLKTEAVMCIAVDGANRKWLGTLNSGVFLVSENGTDEIHHFDETNSPLPSNNIIDIKINEKNGMVYIATENGTVSYRSDATKGDDYFENVYVFPNPVRPNYNGKITITGLVDEVNVKITDISGNLVFETTALGGQAIWNGKTNSGRKVNTGVYMVFCTNKDGSQTHVTKLLFIN